MNHIQNHPITAAQHKNSSSRRNASTAPASHRFLVNETPVHVRYGNDGRLQEIITGMVFSHYTGKSDWTMLQ